MKTPEEAVIEYDNLIKYHSRKLPVQERADGYQEMRISLFKYWHNYKAEVAPEAAFVTQVCVTTIRRMWRAKNAIKRQVWGFGTEFTEEMVHSIQSTSIWGMDPSAFCEILEEAEAHG